MSALQNLNEIIARDDGMREAAQARREALQFARDLAEVMAGTRGEISADDVQSRMVELGFPVSYLRNAAGSIFKDRRIWESVGWKASTRKGRKASAIRLWRLR
jgi:hypothetical protein